MTDWLLAAEGTATGQTLAVALALTAAVLHAIFGALQKGPDGPWLTRGAIDLSYSIIAAPLALFVVPWPGPHMWAIFATVFVIHAGYKMLQAMAYSRGAYTVVYPVVRGTGPLVAVLIAGVAFDETFSPLQWGGLALLLTGIFGLASYNILHATVDRGTLLAAIGLALVTGVFVAIYTTYDAHGIRSAADPFTFLAWFFFLDGVFMPLVVARRLRAMDASRLPALFGRGLIGALVAMFSFGSIMLATRLGNVGEVAVLRETSTVFAALIGWLMLKEAVGPRRLVLMCLIALGAVIVEMGS